MIVITGKSIYMLNVQLTRNDIVFDKAPAPYYLQLISGFGRPISKGGGSPNDENGPQQD
jgi:hypothetical protein